MYRTKDSFWPLSSFAAPTGVLAKLMTGSVTSPPLLAKASIMSQTVTSDRRALRHPAYRVVVVGFGVIVTLSAGGVSLASSGLTSSKDTSLLSSSSLSSPRDRFRSWALTGIGSRITDVICRVESNGAPSQCLRRWKHSSASTDESSLKRKRTSSPGLPVGEEPSPGRGWVPARL